MSWKKEAYKENLPATAIAKIEELEGELEGLKKERKQKLLHFETLDGLLKKTQNENKDMIKQRDKALQELADAEDKQRLHVKASAEHTKELRAKMEVIDMMKAQIDKNKSRAQEVEVELNKANKELDELRADKSVIEKKNEALNKDITRCKDGLLALDTKLKKKTEESQSHLKTISELKVQLVEMDKGTSVNSSISTSSRVGGDKPGSIPNDQEINRMKSELENHKLDIDNLRAALAQAKATAQTAAINFAEERESLNQSLSAAKQQVEKLDADLRKVRAEHTEAIRVAQAAAKPDSRYETLQDQLRDKEAQLQSLQVGHDSISAKLRVEEEQRAFNALKWGSMVAELKTAMQQLEVAETRTADMAGAHEQAMSELLKTKEKEQARYIGQFQTVIYDREGTIEELEGKLETVNKEVSAMAEDLHAHKVAAKSSETTIQSLTSSSNELKEQVRTSKKLNEQLEEEHKRLEAALHSLLESSTSIKQECEAKEKSISSLQETLAAAKQEAKSKADSIESMKEDLVQKDSEIHEHFLKLNNSSVEIDNLRNELNTATHSLRSKESEVRSVTLELEELRAASAVSHTTLAAECEQNVEHVRKCEQLEREVARLTAEHHNWTEVKAKLELRVANLTIENDDLESDAQDAKTNSQGMVDKLQGRVDELERVLMFTKEAILSNDIVQKREQKALEELDRLAKELENVQTLSRAEVSQRDEKIAALETELGSLTKLLADLQHSLVTLQDKLSAEEGEAKNEKEHLARELKQSQAAHAALEEEITQLRAASNATAVEQFSTRTEMERSSAEMTTKIDDLTLALQGERVIVNDLNHQVESLVSKNERLVGRLDEASYERAETIEKHGSEVKSLEERLQSSESRLKQEKAQFEEDKKELVMAKENVEVSLEREGQSNALLEKRVAELTLQVENRTSAVARLQDELVAVKDEIQAKEEEISALKEEISKSSDEQASIDKQLSALTAQMQDKEDVERELREELAKVEESIESINKSLEDSERRNSELVSQGIAARRQATAELEEKEASERRLTELLDSKVQELDTIQEELNNREAAYQRLAEQAHEARVKLQTANSELEYVAASEKALKEQLAASTTELEVLQSSGSELSSQIVAAKDVERALEDKITVLTSELEVNSITKRTLEERLQQKEQEVENTIQFVHNMEASVSKHEEKNRTLMETISQLRNESAEQLNSTVCDLTEKLQAHSTEVERLEAVTSLLENKLAKSEKQETFLTEKVSSLETKLVEQTNLNEDLTAKTANLNDLIAEVERLEAQLASRNEELAAKVKTVEKLELTCQNHVQSHSSLDCDFQQLKHAFAELQRECDKLAESETAAEDKVGDMTAELNAVRSDLEAASQKHAELQEQRENQQRLKEAAETAHSHTQTLLQEHITTSQLAISQQVLQIMSLNQEVDKLKVAHEFLTSDLELTRTKAAEQSAERDRLEAREAELEDQLTGAKDENAKLVAKVEHLKYNMGKSTEDLEKLNSTTEDLSALEKQLEVATNARDVALKEAMHLRGVIDELRDELGDGQGKLEKEKTLLGEARVELNSLELSLIQAKEQHEQEKQSLNTEIERLERDISAVRESSKNDLENIEGRVAEAHDLMAKVNLELGEEKERCQKVEQAHEVLARLSTATSEKFKDTLAELETARSQASDLEGECTKVNDELSRASHSLEECMKQLALAEDKIVQLKEEIAEKEEDYLSLESNFDNIGGECSNVKRDLASIVDKFNDKEDAAQAAEGKVAQLADDLEDKVVELAKLTDKCTQMEIELADAKDQLEELSKKLQVAQEDNSLRVAKEHKLEERLAACETELAEQTANSSESRENAAEFARKVADIDAQRASAELEASALRRSTADLEAQLIRSNDELSVMRAQYAEARSQFDREVISVSEVRVSLEESNKDKSVLEVRVLQLEEIVAAQETSVASLSASLIDACKENERLAEETKALTARFESTALSATKSSEEAMYANDVITKHQTTIESFESSLSELQRELDRANLSIAQLEKELKQATAESGDLNAQVEAAAKERDATSLMFKDYQTTIAQLTTYLQQSKSEHERAIVKFDQVSTDLSELKATTLEKEAQLSTTNTQFANLEVKCAKLEAQLTSATSEASSLTYDKDARLREVVVACDEATTQLRLREAELTRARAEIDRLEDKLAALESDVASLRAEADGAASHAKEVGRSYHIRKDEYVALEAKFKVVADEVVQVRTEKEVEIAELKLQLETESRKLAEEADKFDFLLEQMADLRASVSAGSLPTQSTVELQQKLDKALHDNASLRTQIAKCDADIAALRAQLSAQDNAKAVRLATIERQLIEAVEARDSGLQMIKQKCDEIEKLKHILHSTVASAPSSDDVSKKEEEGEEKEKQDEEDGDKEPLLDEKDFAKELEKTENELHEISEKYDKLINENMKLERERDGFKAKLSLSIKKVSALQAQIEKATPQPTTATSAPQSSVATGLRKVPAFLMGKRPLDPTNGHSTTITTKSEQMSKKVKADTTSSSAKSATFTLDRNSNKYIPNKENSENY